MHCFELFTNKTLTLLKAMLLSPSHRKKTKIYLRKKHTLAKGRLAMHRSPVLLDDKQPGQETLMLLIRSCH